MKNFYMMMGFLILTMIAFEAQSKDDISEYVLPTYCTSLWETIEEKTIEIKSTDYFNRNVLQQDVEDLNLFLLQVPVPEQIHYWECRANKQR